MQILAVLALLAAAQPQAQAPPRVTVFHGPAGGLGSLRTYEVTGGQALGRVLWGNGIRLLPIDHVGRTQLEELLPDRPRLRQDVPGASRLELQGGHGTLYRFERVGPVGHDFGFFRIPPNGRPELLLERPGTGAGQLVDPFLPRVGVSPEGDGMLVATTPAAGGDLLEIDFGLGSVVDRTVGLPPRSYSESGLWLGSTWGFGVSASGVDRFIRRPGKLAQAVSIPGGTPAWFSGEAVMSPGRSRAMTSAGDDVSSQHAYVFGALGPAVRATEVPVHISPAGFEPDWHHGPYMAVSDDGRLCAWRTEGIVSREAHLTRVQATPQPAAQVSADAYFLDTLDEVGQMGFYRGDELHLAVGSIDLVEKTIEDYDSFAIGLDAQDQPVFTNRSLSSGDPTAPFTAKGILSPEVMHRMPDGSLLIYDEKQDRLMALRDGDAAAVMLLASVKEIQLVEAVGGELLLGMRRSFGSKPGELHRVPIDLSSSPTQIPGAGGVDVEFERASTNGVDSVAFHEIVADTQDFVARMDLGTGMYGRWSTAASSFVGPLAWGPDGRTLISEGPLQGPDQIVVWPTQGAASFLITPSAPGFPLP